MPIAVNPYRLSDDVLPRRYALTLTPHLETATFDGYVEIDLEIVTEVDAIVLNAIDLVFHDIVLIHEDGSEAPCTASLDAETERASLRTGSTIGVGTATLAIKFSGILNDLLTGFYRSTYLDPDGVTQTIATSQMEATDARRAFPCFDEPAKKARFDITLIEAMPMGEIEADRSDQFLSLGAVRQEQFRHIDLATPNGVEKWRVAGAVYLVNVGPVSEKSRDFSIISCGGCGGQVADIARTGSAQKIRILSLVEHNGHG